MKAEQGKILTQALSGPANLCVFCVGGTQHPAADLPLYVLCLLFEMVNAPV